jgi:hypothetical protein
LIQTSTLAAAYERFIAGTSPDEALAKFLDAFDRASNVQMLSDTLLDAPRLTGDARLDARAGAVADYLARRHRLLHIPAWAFEPERFLNSPWHTCAYSDHGMREYLTFASPGEFKSRDIFTDEQPLRPGSHLFSALESMRLAPR